MNKSQKALIRQTTIFSRLNAGEVVNVGDLAEEFGVSVRTIQIDLNKRMAIYEIEDLGHGNYRFVEGFRIRTTDNEEEQISLSLMRGLQRSAIPSMNEYIDRALPMVRQYEEMFLFDLALEPITDLGKFKVVLQAIQWRVALMFDYTTKEGEKLRECTVHPYRIANFHRRWYLVAYDLADEKIKTFHFPAIKRMKTLYENFLADEEREKELERLCDGMVSVWYDGEEKSCRLRLSGDARRYLVSNPPPNCEILDQSEQEALMLMRYYNPIEPLALVKHWLPDIRIENNDELQGKLRQTLEEYLRKLS